MLVIFLMKNPIQSKCITSVLSRLLTSEHRHYGSFITDNSYLSLCLLSNLHNNKLIVIPLLLTYQTTLSLFISCYDCIFDIRTRSMWMIFCYTRTLPLLIFSSSCISFFLSFFLSPLIGTLSLCTS